MIRRGILFVAVVVALFACRAMEPTNKPIDMCMKYFEKHASRQCAERECERGCELILDRMLEKEGEGVVKCVGRQARRCGDVVWAECASHVGVHADGGPPGPPPPADDWE